MVGRRQSGGQGTPHRKEGEPWYICGAERRPARVRKCEGGGVWLVKKLEGNAGPWRAS